MDAETLIGFGKIAGLGGLALGVFVVLFRQLLTRVALNSFSRKQSFAIVLTFMILTWTVALAGIGAWVYGRNKTEPIRRDEAVESKEPVEKVRVESSVNWKTRKRTIVLILNEETLHVRKVAAAFELEVSNRMGPWNRIIEKIGGANMKDDVRNQKAFADALRESDGKPDLVVTIGTQVSVYASKNYNTLPRFFVAVTDPIGSELITPSEVKTRLSNVAGFASGIDKEHMVKDLARCFPGQTFGFLYGKEQLQDRQMLDFLKSQRTIRFVPIEANVSAPTVDASLVRGIKLVFGWNMLNTNIDMFVRANPTLAFIGPQYENIQSGVVASYGADFDQLGRSAADFLVDHFFGHGSALGELPIEFPDTAKMLISKQQMQAFGLVRGSECTSTETP